ncbi:MAG: hypothetical protein ACPG7F_12415 [Aggregatilineales bacterium]
MTWTTPRTWLTGEILTASDMNTHLRDNLDALKDPPTDHYMLDEISNYSTTSTTFVDIDNTNLSLTIETTGGDVLVGFVGGFTSTVNGIVFLELDLDGVVVGGDDGITAGICETTAPGTTMSFVWLLTGLSAGSHTVALQWRVTGGTARLYAGAGTTSADIHPQFWIREVS